LPHHDDVSDAATPPPDPNARLEAERFGRYLAGRPIEPHLVDRYVAAMEQLRPTIGARDRRRIRLALAHPRLIGFVDGGLALRDPHSVLRWKLVAMSAILEATPDYADAYLPRHRLPRYAVYAAFVGLRAAVRSAIGIVLVSLL
jgi:hypothetical protein